MERLAQFALVGASVLAVQTSAVAGKADDTVVWATASEIDTADVYYQNLRGVVIAALTMCDSLLHLNPLTHEYEPLLAQSYKWVDPRTLDFTLREGIKFANGKSFGAKDVAYTLTHARQPDGSEEHTSELPSLMRTT